MKALLFASLLVFCGFAHAAVFGKGPVLYKVKIKTRGLPGDGTNAEVKFKIGGFLTDSKGSRHLETTPVLLDTPNYDDFERGSEDTFDVRGIDVGNMHTFWLKIDRTGSSSLWPWRVDWVEVKKMKKDGTVQQTEKLYYEDWLPKYTWEKVWSNRPRG